MYRIASQKFEDPADGEEAVTRRLSDLHDDTLASFRQLEDEFRGEISLFRVWGGGF